ncbi:MAG TPA: sulfatase-like hydrolase/transferase [Solirubrobacteraceae bacterium]|nr:sulfatase-like hydrolase/transferase [Solirubrobacteraceae bacterium]
MPDRFTDSSRRTFIKRGLLTGGSLALATAGAPAPAQARRPRRARRSGAARRRPNILVILVDQLRSPAWVPASVALDTLLPNLAALRRKSVSFERHYTASNDCSPSRGVLLTGLYSHQTRCMITGRSRLSPGFPTWGTLLREMGYATTWWGKWHLNPRADAPLEQYGFAGGTYPSPNGGPGQGTEVDPSIVDQFQAWFGEEAGREPWCSTVSLVNPHDVAWWYRFTSEVESESNPPGLVNQMPPNFETPEDLQAHGKPLLHRSLQETAARSFGAVPFSGPEALSTWSGLMNTYLLLQGYVDRQIGRVLATLDSRPEVRKNTVILFTSDHGEYGGSHGMRGKGASAYEEAIRVPLYVHDHRGVATAAPGTTRRQLTSSADIVGLLLSIADGSNAWRSESSLAHLSTRQDLAAICADPAAPGRPWVLHATDEDVTEFAADPHDAEAPRHVVALRTQQGKLGLYSNWGQESIDVQPGGQEVELYDYSTPSGQAELTNAAGSGALQETLQSILEEDAIPNELRAPLPGYLEKAQREGMRNYLGVEEIETEKAEDSHRGSAPSEEFTVEEITSEEPMPD